MATFLLIVTLATAVVGQVLTDEPEECQDSDFCDIVPRDYPREAIDKYIEQNRSLLQVDSLSDDDYIARQGAPEDDLELCKSTKKVIYPLQARGIDNRWHTLVNRQNNPAQGFRVEVCKEAGSSCDAIITFNTGFSGHCVQKYIQRSVPVMNRESDGEWSVRQQVVNFPSCCACGAQASG